MTNNESSATAVLAGDGLIDRADPSGTDTNPDGALPRTGFGAIPLTALGFGLVGVGEALRRRRRSA